MSRLDEIRKRLACLVPKPESISEDSMLLSSHEKTLCDCEVLTLLDMLDEAKEYINKAELQFGYFQNNPDNIRDKMDWIISRSCFMKDQARQLLNKWREKLK